MRGPAIVNLAQVAKYWLPTDRGVVAVIQCGKPHSRSGAPARSIQDKIG